MPSTKRRRTHPSPTTSRHNRWSPLPLPPPSSTPSRKLQGRRRWGATKCQLRRALAVERERSIHAAATTTSTLQNSTGGLDTIDIAQPIVSLRIAVRPVRTGTGGVVVRSTTRDVTWYQGGGTYTPIRRCKARSSDEDKIRRKIKCLPGTR